MKYVPHLIAKEYRVLQEDYKGQIYGNSKRHIGHRILGWVIGLIYILTALAFIKSLWLLLIFGTIIFVNIPPLIALLEKKLVFQLTPKISYIATGVLFIISLPLINNYLEHEQALLKKEQAIAAQKKAAEEEQQKERQQAKDSFEYYRNVVVDLIEKKEYPKAQEELTQLNRFAIDTEEKLVIERLSDAIIQSEIDELFKRKKYRQVLPKIETYLQYSNNKADLLYKRAVCLHIKGETREAVRDLKRAIKLGYSGAEELHDKINPLRRRVAYYVTRCCDGSTSNAKGRGACSHHGGVCNWNDPVYETYRKY